MSLLDTLMKQRAPAAPADSTPHPSVRRTLGEAMQPLQASKDPGTAGEGEGESTGGGSRGPAHQYQHHDAIKGTPGTMGLAGASGGTPEAAPDVEDDPFAHGPDPFETQPKAPLPPMPGSLGAALGRSRSPFAELDSPDANEPSPDLHPDAPGQRRRPRM